MHSRFTWSEKQWFLLHRWNCARESVLRWCRPVGISLLQDVTRSAVVRAVVLDQSRDSCALQCIETVQRGALAGQKKRAIWLARKDENSLFKSAIFYHLAIVGTLCKTSSLSLNRGDSCDLEILGASFQARLPSPSHRLRLHSGCGPSSSHPLATLTLLRTLYWITALQSVCIESSRETDAR